MNQTNGIQIHAACGPVVGEKWRRGGIFRGIPYGKAERFRAPQPVSWEQPRLCLEYGAPAPQPASRGVRPSETEDPFRMDGSEDCLNLNVWSPAVNPEEKFPVVVFVHGGAFQYGSNARPGSDGSRFMGNEELLYISVNYRLGVMGFLELGEALGEDYAGSGNCGMMDLLLAVRWVKDNCSFFGGDPERIILMGISAGAKAIASLLTLPEIQSCCSRVILESGGMQSFRTIRTAAAAADRFLKLLPEGTDIRTAPAEKILEAQAEFCAADGSTCFFGPVLEAPFAQDWRERWDRGERFRGKVVIGGCRHEMIQAAEKKHTEEEFRILSEELFGKNGALAGKMAKQRLKEGIPLQAAWEPVLSDFMYRYYGNKLAAKMESDGCLVRCYSFDYGNACHGMGFAYLTGDLKYAAQNHGEEAKREARHVSDVMREYILAWIRNDGSDEEQWPLYRGGSKLVLDAEPHMEFRPGDSLTGFPEQVYCL